VTFRRAVEIVQRHFMCKLSDAPFDRKSVDLVAGSGACTTCSHRTGAQPELFDDVKSPDVCTEPGCFAKKTDAHWKLLQREAKANGQRVLSQAETKEVFPYGDSPQKGFVALSSQCYDDSKRRTYAQIAGKTLDRSKVVLARTPSGDIVELIPQSIAKKLEPKRKPSKSEQRWAEDKKKRKAEQAKRDESARARMALLIAKAEQTQPDLDFWRWLAGAAAENGYAQDVAKRRGIEFDSKKFGSSTRAVVAASEEMNAQQLRGLVVELLCCGYRPENRVSACKLYGIAAAPDDIEESDALAEEDLDAGDGPSDDDPLGEDVACRLCGCTEHTPCPGGCQWVPDPEQLGELCSACLPGVNEKLNKEAIEESGESFHCPACDRDVPLESGGADDYPALCADCANDATDRMLSEELYIQGMRAIRAAKAEQPSQAAVDATVAAVAGKQDDADARPAWAKGIDALGKPLPRPDQVLKGQVWLDGCGELQLVNQVTGSTPAMILYENENGDHDQDVVTTLLNPRTGWDLMREAPAPDHCSTCMQPKSKARKGKAKKQEATP